MRTQDILALNNRPFADQRGAPDRRGILFGAVLAAIFVFALVISAALRHAQAAAPAPEPDLGRFSTNLDRSGALYTLEIRF